VIGILDWELCTLGSPVRTKARAYALDCSRVRLTNHPGALLVAGGFGKLDAALGP
jgi:hypothetical protein